MRGARRADAGLRFDTPEGVRVLVEESHVLPLVDFQIILRTGSVLDPPRKEGLTRLAWRLVRMGTPELEGPEVEEAVSRLGGRLAVEVSTSYVAVHGAVIRRNFEPFFGLVVDLIRRPAFRAKDLGQVRRETLADLVALRDNDRSLAARCLRRTLFAGHAYGRPVSGTAETVRALTRDDVVAAHRRTLLGPNLLLGFSGDLTAGEAQRLCERLLGGLPRKPPPRDAVPAPRALRGRRVVVVDKPDRSQTQLFVGGLGLRAGDPHYYPLLVGNSAFGGTFTSTLMQEVREKRGWSYGAYSRIGTDRQRDAWYMYSFPGASQVVDCLKLELELLEQLLQDGITAEQHRFARRYLANSHCFDVDTAAKRLEPRLDEELYSLPLGYYQQYERNVRRVTRAQVNEGIGARLTARHLTITLTATAKRLVPELEKLPGVSEVTVLRYTAV